MGDGVRRQVGEVAVGAGAVRLGLRRGEDPAPHPPGMAVLQVVSEFLAEGDVGADAAVEEVLRPGLQQLLHLGRQELEIFQDVGADLQMHAHPPGPGGVGECEQQQGRQQAYLQGVGLMRGSLLKG